MPLMSSNHSPSVVHLDQATQSWNLTKESTLHRRVENFIYMTSDASSEKVLRLTEPGRRSLEDLKSELDWQIWLTRNGADSAAPVLSKQGNLVEELRDGDVVFFASLFEKAEGGPLRNAADFTVDIMKSWGATLGKMHSLTRDYEPQAHVKRRKEWDVDFHSSLPGSYRDLPDSVASRFQKSLMDWMASLPKDRNVYGLVHTDLHSGNFFVTDNKLTVFDFDDSCYHWFAYDLAVPPFYLRYMNQTREMGLDLATLEQAYFAGYSSTHHLEEIWFERIETFISYRALLMYRWCQAQLRDQKLDEDTLEWCRSYMKYCEATYFVGEPRVL